MVSVPPFPCPICGNTREWYFIAQEATPRGEVVEIKQCEACGLHVTYPRHEDAQREYRVFTPEQFAQKYGAIDRGERLHDRDQNYREEVITIQQLVPQGRVLDVGCNAGWLLGYLRQAGTFEIEGVEPSSTLAGIARQRLPGVMIHVGYLHEVTGRDGYFDAVIATDVIEHIEPEALDQFVGAIKRLLKPGGYVFLKTPNAHYMKLKHRLVQALPGALTRRLLRAQDTWDAKEHLIHWDAANMQRYFRQQGFTPLRVFVPLPVQTRGSHRITTLLRRLIYLVGKARGGVPFFSQDMFFIGQKNL